MTNPTNQTDPDMPDPRVEKVALAAAAIVDIWMGGDQSWRDRLSDSDFLESADWQRATEEAKAVLSILDNEATRSDEALKHDLERALAREHALLNAATPSNEALLREALTKCRDRFREYVVIHQGKIEPKHELVPFDLRDKIRRNEEMVELCDAALNPQGAE